MAEIRDIAPGLWIWRLEHPDYRSQSDWDGVITCTCVESGGEVAVFDRFARRYGAPGYGPALFFPGDAPETEVKWIRRGDELPGGLRALHDGRGEAETPLWLPEQRALVFADALTAPEGELRVWATPEHERWTLPALRAMLELPFEHLIVSHGEPVHDRAEFERALELPTWS